MSERSLHVSGSQNSFSRRPSEIKFILIFITCYAVFHTLYYFIPDNILRDIFHYYGIVLLSADIVNWLSPQEQVAAIENKLVSAKATLNVVRGCDGAGVTFLLLAAIIAFRADFKYKIAGILAGILFLYFINQVRIVGLYFVVVHERELFLPIHTYFAPTLIVVLSCIFFAIWVIKASQGITKHESAKATSH